MSAIDLSTESLLARRALAEKATPGPWANYDTVKSLFGCEPFDWGNVYARLHDNRLWIIMSMNNNMITEEEKEQAWKDKRKYDPGQSGKNAAFVAANDPTTVIATIGEIIRLRGEVERLEKEADWLAENCWKKTDCEYIPPRILRDGICYECSHDCRKCWREAARRATEEER